MMVPFFLLFGVAEEKVIDSIYLLWVEYLAIKCHYSNCALTYLVLIFASSAWRWNCFLRICSALNASEYYFLHVVGTFQISIAVMSCIGITFYGPWPLKVAICFSQDTHFGNVNLVLCVASTLEHLFLALFYCCWAYPSLPLHVMIQVWCLLIAYFLFPFPNVELWFLYRQHVNWKSIAWNAQLNTYWWFI